MTRLLHRKVNHKGLVMVEGVIFQAPLEFAGQVIRVDAERQEFFPNWPEIDLGYPVLKRAHADMQA